MRILPSQPLTTTFRILVGSPEIQITARKSAIMDGFYLTRLMKKFSERTFGNEGVTSGYS